MPKPDVPNPLRALRLVAQDRFITRVETCEGVPLALEANGDLVVRHKQPGRVVVTCSFVLDADCVFSAEATAPRP